MQRPDFVTEADITRWSGVIENERAVYQQLGNLIDIPVIREVIYAGLWLGESLQQLNCHPDLIVRIQYVAGQLSFGRDPWAVVQEVLKAYKDNDMEFEIDYNQN